MPDVQVLVVVVTYNSEDVLADCLASLPQGLGGLSWRLVVVDNDSADGSVALARALAPQAVVLERHDNGGYAAGINAGVHAGPSSEAVLVLNPDVRLHTGCVPELLARMGPKAGIAVPRLVDGVGTLIPTIRREPTVLRAFCDAVLGGTRAGRWSSLGEVVTDERSYERLGAVDWAEGSTVLFTAECWRRCGPWDDSFFLYSEETDFALRARDHGLLTVFVPSASAVHLEGASRTSPALWALLMANKVRLFRRRNGLVRSAAFWACLVLREASRGALGKPTSRAALRTLLSPGRLRQRPGPDTVAPSSGRVLPTQKVA